MASLEWLDLRENSISNVDDVAELQTVPTLRSLFLRNDSGGEANPACGHPAYMSIIMRNLPQLMILDGIPRMCIGIFYSVQEAWSA